MTDEQQFHEENQAHQQKKSRRTKQRQEVTNSADWFDAELVGEAKPSRLSAVIFFAVCAVAIFAVVAYGAVDVWALGLTSIFVGAIAVLWLADGWMKREFVFDSSVLQLPLLGLIAVGLIQLLPLRASNISNDLLNIPAVESLSLAPYLTRLAVGQLILYFVFFAAALAFINNEKRLRKTVLTVIIFGAFGAFFGILQRLAGGNSIYGLRDTDQAITFASYINQHHFAALMEMTAGLTLALLFGNATKKDKRIFLIAAAIVMGMALVFTGSRGGLISFVAVLGFIVAANALNKQNAGKSAEDEDDGGGDRSEKSSGFRRSFTLVIGGLALILGLFGAVLILGGDQSVLRGIGLQATQNGDVSNGRLYFWSVAVKIISDFPLLGGGLDAFGIAFTRYDTTNGALRVEQAHNDYLQILADAGIAGFACVAAFIFLLFKKGLRVVAKSSDNFRRSVAVGALAGCFGILIHSLFDFPLRTPANGYFFLILATLATASINYPKLYKKQRRRKTEDRI